MRNTKTMLACPLIYSTFALLVMALLQGCATALLAQAPVTSTETKCSIFARDVITAIGYPEQNGKKVGGLLLLGENFSYLLTKGEDKIDLIVSELNPKYVNMENVTTLVKNENSFNGRFNFKYAKYNNYSIQETNALNRLCNKTTLPGKWFGFGKPQVYYDYCWVNVSGSLFASQNSTLSENIKLKEGHSILLVVNEGSKTSIDAMKVTDKLFALPFAVGFDLVTSPLQLFLLSKQNK